MNKLSSRKTCHLLYNIHMTSNTGITMDWIKNAKVSPFTTIFLKDGDKILTVKRSSKKQLHPNKWSVFGGKVEPGENILNSAKREFLEETGLTLKKLTLKGTFTRMILNTGYINVIHIFLAQGYTGEVLKESDEGQIMWRYIEEFLNDSETVDHLKYYLFQLLDENSDFYTGIEIKNDIENSAYNDNREHFNGRKINNVPYGK